MEERKQETSNDLNTFLLPKEIREVIKATHKEGYITSLELLEQINIFRKQERNRAELRHDTLLNIIRDEFSEEIGFQKILEAPYTHPQNKQKHPMFVLTYEQGKQVLMRESKFVRKAVIKYIKTLEKKVNNFSELDMLYARLHRTNDHLELKEITDKIIFLETRLLKKEIEHKTNIITSLTHEIADKDKRTIINQVVRKKGVDFTSERWNALYYEFDKVGHYNIKTRVKNYQKKNDVKISRIEYIEKELKQIDLLFRLTCKLFESDINEIINQYKKII